jgi:hypothetical protein
MSLCVFVDELGVVRACESLNSAPMAQAKVLCVRAFPRVPAALPFAGHHVAPLEKNNKSIVEQFSDDASID